MEMPFVFGKVADPKNFTDREEETARLVANFRSLVNTILISPRRWGKSSLVNKAAAEVTAADKKLRICMLDLYNVDDENQFYAALAAAVIKATSTKWQERVENTKKFFSRLVPKLTLSPDPSAEISIDFDWEEVKRNPDEILDLAEKIAQDKKLKIVVCIDEFQNIAEFSKPLAFQKRLRAHWQRHGHVGYCLYGSKRHMMMEVFSNASAPFYKFGDMMFLDKIQTPYWLDFIQRRFAETGKKISLAAARAIVEHADNHPYYVQQLAQLAWLRTKQSCSEQIVNEAHAALVGQLSLLFETITETLSSQHINYLLAVMAGEKKLTSTEIMRRYRIASSTVAVRSRNELIKRDILDNQAGRLSLQDPIYAYWLKTRFPQPR